MTDSKWKNPPYVTYDHCYIFPALLVVEISVARVDCEMAFCSQARLTRGIAFLDTWSVAPFIFS